MLVYFFSDMNVRVALRAFEDDREIWPWDLLLGLRTEAQVGLLAVVLCVGFCSLGIIIWSLMDIF